MEATGLPPLVSKFIAFGPVFLNINAPDPFSLPVASLH